MARDLTIATCQHPVGADIKANYNTIRKHILFAVSNQADIVHFSECNLSGYAGGDFLSYDTQDESLLQQSLENIRNLAADSKIWLIIGSHHFEKNQEKPFNSLYLINDQGQIHARYDKRLLACVGDDQEDLYYTPGSGSLLFTLKGIKCGLLICHEWRYPEVYREYYRLGAEIIFQSWYDAKLTMKKYKDEGKDRGELIVSTIRSNAASNHIWISASNTSNSESCFPSSLVQPDGKIYGKLSRNRSGVLVSTIDLDKRYKDPSSHLRDSISSRIRM